MSYLARLKALDLKTAYPPEASKAAEVPFDPFAGSPPPCNLEVATPRFDADQVAERAAIVQEGACVPREWAEGFATLEARPAPRGVNEAEWLAMMNAAGRFLDEWGAKAAALGWTAGELFALDAQAPMGRLDRRGAGFFLARCKVVAITATEIVVKAGDSVQRVYRKVGLGLPGWESAA